MEEERIKSALEIAMERISALPELTPEEIAAQKEKQFRPVGEAIAARYLSGLITEEELPDELDKNRGDQWQIVLRSLISSLCKALQFDADATSAGKALNGIRLLAPEKGSFIMKAAGEYQSIVHEFEQDKKNHAEGFEKTVLRPLGISGTAVRCNPAENALWLEVLEKLRSTYKPRVETVRAELFKELMES